MTQLTPEQLEEQLACLHSGILWIGTEKQVSASALDEEGNPKSNPSTVDRQLAAMDPTEARKIRRRYRKLWRAAARRRGLVGKMSGLHPGSKSLLARDEALRIYRSHQEQQEKA